MHKRLKSSFVVVGVFVLVLGGVGFGFAAPQDQSIGVSPPMEPRVPGSSPKFHMVEVLTGVWCPPCGIADPALSRITDEWADNALVLAYHCCSTNPASGNYDPWFDSTVLVPRDSFYGFQYLPTVAIDGGGRYPDGTLFIIGAASPTSASYDMYRVPLEDYSDTTSNVAVALDADLTPMSVLASVTVTATDPLDPAETNLYLRTVVYEDGLYWPQANGIPYHRNIARALNEQMLPLSYPGSVTLTATFPLNPAWNPSKLGIVSFVQSGTTRALNIPGYPNHYGSDILNAAKHEFAPRGVLVHRDQGTAADYTEAFEQVLADAGEVFDTYNEYAVGSDLGTSDVRGLPSGQRLADSSVLVWNTGPTSSSVLDANDRALLSSYLDGSGSLLLSGSGIGFDGFSQYRTFFEQYLHASYGGDDAGASYVNGVAGDPIGDLFSATNLNVLASPDRIGPRAGDPAMPAAPFVYPFGSPPWPGSVRVQHDSDSRVVYLGFQFFEVGDPNRAAVMTEILDWIDGAAPPVVDVLSPDGGEQFAQGASVNLRWHADDVRIPANGVDIFWTEDYPNTPWLPVATGEPNDGLFRWTVPNVDSATCRVRVVVRDGSPETGDGQAISDADFTCGAVPFFQITFSSAELGWRLVSHPMILADTSVPTVLSSVGGSYSTVRAFDPSDTASPWQRYVPGRAGNDLQYLDNTRGFWIRITAPCTLQVMGTWPGTPQYVILQTGWNLVGFPSSRVDYTISDLKADTGATRVEGFDSTAAPYYLRVLGDTEALRAGAGYWVYVPADTVWTVPS